MAEVVIPNFTPSRRQTRTYDLKNDVSDTLRAIIELLCPAGTIISSLSPIEPETGWKLCNGQALSKAEYPSLFAMLGGTFGETEAEFFLPDLRGRMLLGASESTLQFGGAATVTLMIDQLPAHDHELTDPGHTHVVVDPGHTHAALIPADGEVGLTDGAGITAGDTGSAETGITIEPQLTGVTMGQTGEGRPIDILPPHFTVNWLVRT